MLTNMQYNPKEKKTYIFDASDDFLISQLSSVEEPTEDRANDPSAQLHTIQEGGSSMATPDGALNVTCSRLEESEELSGRPALLPDLHSLQTDGNDRYQKIAIASYCSLLNDEPLSLEESLALSQSIKSSLQSL